MSLSLSEALKKAHQGGYALGAFNACDAVAFKAITQAALALSAPVIIESSPGETEFLGAKNLVALTENFCQEEAFPAFVNLDHSRALPEIEKGMVAGYDMVHFDGSDLPLEENINKAGLVVSWAHPHGILVEAEMDKITGESRPHRAEAESVQAAGVYTDPEKAASFVKKTQADLLAVFVGNVHGSYKSPIKLDLERLKLVRKKISCFLSLHGGSGVDPDDLKKAIKVGRIVKINVSTDLRVAYRQALEKSLSQNPEEVRGYKFFAPVVSAVSKVVEEKIKLFGSEGKA